VILGEKNGGGFPSSGDNPPEQKYKVDGHHTHDNRTDASFRPVVQKGNTISLKPQHNWFN
jgi:hypothetical protein